MLLISDDMRLLSEEEATLFRAVATIGAEVASTDEPLIARTLMEDSTLKIVSTRTRNGALHLLINMSDCAQDARLAEVVERDRRASIVELAGEADAPERIELPPHSARIIRGG
jgi:hypothetical protein